MEIKVLKSLIQANEDFAQKIREKLTKNNIKMFNIISSPGSGKTSLLEKTIESLHMKYRLAIIEGDITTDKDAQRLKHDNVPIVLINTQGGCYLNSNSILQALEELDLKNLDMIFIENVGNLVCPSEFDLGENGKIALLSITEGDDKPAKYPMLFRDASTIILNKLDLIEYVNFNKDVFYQELKEINPKAEVIEISCTKNTGLEHWYSWLQLQLSKK